MRAWRVRVTYLMLISMGLQMLAIQPAAGDHFFGRLFRLEKEKFYHGTEPATCTDGAIEYLAENIDWLEHHVDKYGSIVAKQPDVWGEARMTKHRDEYERMMFEQLNQFQFRINANITQTDSSFLAQAFALSAAVDGDGGAETPAVAVASSGSSSSGGQQAAPAAGPTLNTVTAQLADPDDISVSLDKIQGSKNVGLEPTLYIDQLSRYLQHLHELRRINEGDDTSDSPGYAMNLVRIPVSMLPGKLTREGFGAEITLTGTPVLSDDLLPNTFRNLVVNDLVDQLGLPLVKTAENPALLDLWRLNQQAPVVIERARVAFLEWNFLDNPTDREEVSKLVKDIIDNPRARAIIQQALYEADDDFGIITESLRYTKRAERIATYGNQIKATDQYAADLLAEFIEHMLRHRRINDPKDLDAAKIALHNAIISMGMQSALADAIEQQRALRLSQNSAQTNDVTFEDVSSALKQVDLPLNALPAELQVVEPIEQKQRQKQSLLEESRTLRGQQAVQRQPRVPREPAQQAAADEASLQAEATQAVIDANQYVRSAEDARENVSTVFDNFVAVLDRVAEIAPQFRDQVEEESTSPAVSVSGRARRASQPVPPSQVVAVYGSELFCVTADFFCPAYSGRQIRWAGQPYCSTVEADGKKAKAPTEFRVDLLDVQKWLQAELAAAHELLSQPPHLQLWYELSNPRSGLAAAIRKGHLRGKEYSPEAEMMSSVSPTSYQIPPSAYCPPSEIEEEEIETPPALGNVTLEFGTNSSVEDYRNFFLEQIHSPHFTSDADPRRSVLEHLAWAIVVESALLNQRLNEDMRKVATAKQCGCMAPGGQDLSFFLPEVAANPEHGLAEEFTTAAQVFQEYVRCRWPIHVFAIDPREQDQNVADASARRRELQFALALGFVSGEISAHSLTQYSRELETQIETISLNRTIVGFAHANDTFGWRFYPRVQALDVPGAAGTIWQSIHGTPRDADVRKRQLEPGMRECVAIVLMPSFVPYVDFDVRTNWFKLTNPKNAALTMKDTMRLSRAVTAMRNSRAQAAQCAHCYREGEVERLMTRIDQLDRELPLQTMRSQIPYENTLGGFEMFNTGITDLAPQLIGWYGAPGVVVNSPGATSDYACGCYKQCDQCTCEKCNSCPPCVSPTTATGDPNLRAFAQPPAICEGVGTTLFLVGDHLSVHDTKVIAGGVCIPHVRLVSRQIARVTIPSCVNKVTVDGKEYVAVYAATPYGVTNHLHIPVEPSAKAKEQKAIEDSLKAIQANLTLLGEGTPVVTTTEKLKVDAECKATGKSEVVLRPTMPTDITVSLSPAARPVTGTRYILAVRYKGLFLKGLIDVEVKPFLSGDNVAFKMLLDAPSGAPVPPGASTPLSVREQIVQQLGLAQPTITTTSFDDKGKAAATAHLYLVTPAGDRRPIAGEIPIEITLACNCCENLPQPAPKATAPAAGAAAATVAPTPGGAQIPPSTAPPTGATSTTTQPPEPISADGPELKSSPQTNVPCNCPTTASTTELLIR